MTYGQDHPCHVCGEDGVIFDRRGGWCREHWDAAETAKRQEAADQTRAPGGPWPQTCPRRAETFGPWQRFDGLDTWDIREQFHDGVVARHCSFCGSLHPEDLIRLVREGYTVQGTDKSYKLYLLDPSGAMASKFYTAHLADETLTALAAAVSTPGPKEWQ